jgi:hypothetical protein
VEMKGILKKKVEKILDSEYNKVNPYRRLP